MNNISIFKKCSNCGACYNSCPVDAIKVKRGNLFFEVEVNERLCINCGKCIKVCPVNSPERLQSIKNAYALVHKNTGVVEKSSSGGAFSAFAEYVLENGGAVWGAIFSEDYKSVIFSSTDNVSIDELRRSKYTESSPGLAYRSILQMLKSKRIVLFCGAPCQVAGLKRFVGQYDDLLITCDFSCGGFASSEMYKAWIEQLERKYKSKVTSVNFRDKSFGWGTHAFCVSFSNGKKHLSPAVFDPYFAAFVGKKINIRDYCCECQFSDNHYSDLILADYWLYKKISNLPQNNKGISLVITNSEKGQDLLDKIKDRVFIEKIDTRQAVYNIKPTIINPQKSINRNNFLNDYLKLGLIPAANKHFLPKWKDKVLFYLKSFIKRMLWRKS